jgi:hypothetical protein
MSWTFEISILKKGEDDIYIYIYIQIKIDKFYLDKQNLDIYIYYQFHALYPFPWLKTVEIKWLWYLAMGTFGSIQAKYLPETWKFDHYRACLLLNLFNYKNDGYVYLKYWSFVFINNAINTSSSLCTSSSLLTCMGVPRRTSNLVIKKIKNKNCSHLLVN